MTSSRLPGKVLLPAAGRPMLQHLIERLQNVASLDGIVVATTVNPSDDPIEGLCKQLGVACFRGSEADVLSRVIGAALSQAAETVVEITADCPILAPGLVEQVIRTFRHNACDYASNAHVRSYPDGMDVQVVTLAALESSAKAPLTRLDREHVTLYIRSHPELYRQLHLVAPPEEHWPELGLTLDEEADYLLLKRLLERFEGQHPTCRDLVGFLRAHPDWVGINANVVRKGDS